MALGCGASCVKCLVVFFNFLAFASGAAILIAGVVFLVTGMKVAGVDTVNIKVALYVAIAVGGIIMVLGFIGCCGALCESQCLLATFSTIMIILLLVQIAAAIFAFVFKDNMKGDLFKTSLEKSYTEATTNQNTCDAWKLMQDSLKCCGTNGINAPNCNSGGVRLTCPSGANNTPCYTALYEFWANSAMVIGIVFIVFAILELAAVIFSCCLCCSIRNGRRLYE